MDKLARILIVEDESLEALSLQTVLTRLGYTVTAAVASGQEAIEQAAQLRPDLVLMDISLAGALDGIETGACLQAHGQVPLIYLTGRKDDQLLERMKATEPYGYVLKPYQVPQLQAAIELAMYKHSLAENLRETNRKLEQEIAARRESEIQYRTLAQENARLLEQSRQDADIKANLLHEVNHRVKNNLAAIIGLLQLELRYVEAAEQVRYRALVNDLTTRIQSLALVHNLLAAGLWAPLPLAKLAQNVLQIALVMVSRQQPVELDIAPTAVALGPKQASTLGLILNELTTNSVKYALRAGEPLALSLRASQSGDQVCLDYRDNGPGFPENVLAGERRSMGLYLIEALATNDLGGELTLSNDCGAVAQLRFALMPGLQSDGSPTSHDPPHSLQ